MRTLAEMPRMISTRQMKPVVKIVEPVLSRPGTMSVPGVCACEGGCPRCSGIQAKLRISQPEDACEREADRVAAAMIHQGESLTIAHTPESDVQRQCTNCSQPEEADEQLVMGKTRSGIGGVKASGDLSVLNTSGQPLAPGLRQSFETRLGQDFSGVRIHTGSQASQLAQILDARAFTYGQDIVFDDNEYQPESSQGQTLLAHELTHVVQQKQAGLAIQRQPAGNAVDEFCNVMEPYWGYLPFPIGVTGAVGCMLATMPTSGERALAIAQAEYNKNVIETPSCTNRSPVVDKYTGITGPLPVIVNGKRTSGTCGEPWCAYFIKWCLNQAGITHAVGPAAVSVKNWGKKIKSFYPPAQAAPGDLFYILPSTTTSVSQKWPSHPCDSPSTPCVRAGHGSGHVGFVLSVSGTNITTIEGNAHISATEDGIASHVRPFSDIEGVVKIP